LILLSAIDHDDCLAAYAWHRGFTAANDSLFPRSRDDFEQLVMEGSVWAARATAGDYLALSYASFDEVKKECEIGGLMVATQARGKGLGLLMMRLPLIHALLEEDMLADPEVRIVAHVLRDNSNPRNIIEHHLAFAHARSVAIPKEALPGLRADADGFIRGDEFELVRPTSLVALASWASSWDGQLADGDVADIEFRPGVTIDVWRRELVELVRRHTAVTGPEQDVSHPTSQAPV